ncbi:MAG: DUF2007 domain-containing protein [Bacteroidales bacterium]|jgi:putative lipoic acid-binding regulatory protein|nr:DUF2007 domain-containing protein [Bacteroidales bacterium]
MEENMKTLVIYRFDYRAEILRNKLEEIGINCMVSQDSAFGDAVGVQVSVFEKDFEKAMEVYQELEKNYEQEK